MFDHGFPHDDLDDALPETFRVDFDLGEAKPGYCVANDTLIEQQLHYEPCRKCRGTGRFVGYTGRAVGQCFTCKGKGKIGFKTSPEERAAKRSAAGKARQSKMDEWIAANAKVYGFLLGGKMQGHALSIDLLDRLHQYGSLTDRQIEMVQGWIAKKAEREAEAQRRAAAAPAITVEKIEQAFDHARDSGLKRLALRLDTFKFKPAPAGGKNAGAIYVTEDEQYLGKIAGGKFMRVRDCSDEQQDRILVVAADPAAAAVAYGKRFGVCSCCGQELTNALSIELGIGPICRGKWRL